MELVDANLYLPLSNGMSIHDVYEEQVFKYKQFFLTNVPTSKTFNLKRKKLDLINQAYLLLSGDPEEDCSSAIDLQDLISDNVRGVFETYQDNANLLKLKISRCSSAKCVGELAQLLLVNKAIYASFWDLSLENTSAEIFISKEPDPVEMLNVINLFQAEGNNSFDEIVKLDRDNLLYRESIRLSLWLKMESDEGSI